MKNRPKTKSRLNKALKITSLVLAAILIILSGGFYIYTLDYYRADASAIQIMEGGAERIATVDGMTVFSPDPEQDSGKGLIFYPGGKVEAIAYAPILEKLSQGGLTCVLLKMPFNLAVFNVNAADKVYDRLPDVEHWFLAGHSLGGAMASAYVEKNRGKLEGLILLGAYPVNDSDIPTLAIYGSEDLGLDVAKLDGVTFKTPIVGGNHAYFGNYGEQEGDGTASISREEQQALAVDAILHFIWMQSFT